jgi:IS30 family transposase
MAVNITDEERDYIISLWDRKFSKVDIAACSGRCLSTVKRVISKEKLKRAR